jgi:hypothetical protein
MRGLCLDVIARRRPAEISDAERQHAGTPCREYKGSLEAHRRVPAAQFPLTRRHFADDASGISTTIFCKLIGSD